MFILHDIAIGTGKHPGRVKGKCTDHISIYSVRDLLWPLPAYDGRAAKQINFTTKDLFVPKIDNRKIAALKGESICM